MISLIICSVRSSYLKDIRDNIEATIGLPYELLVWDNKVEKRGLCDVYNSLAAQATFPYLVFLHEDIIFKTDNWGRILRDIFQADPETGLVGIAGSRYKSGTYSGWWTDKPDLDYFNITHRTRGVDHKMLHPADGIHAVHPVVCIDGVLMACRKEAWEDSRFDNVLLKGFHFYDIDFSLRVSLRWKVVVTLDIDLVHITLGGDYGDSWVREAMRYHRCERDRFPVALSEVRAQYQTEALDTFIASRWLDRLRNEPISFSYKWQWLRQEQLTFRKLQVWYPVIKFLLYRPLRLDIIHNFVKRIRIRYP